MQVIEIFFTLHMQILSSIGAHCSVSKAKHDQVFSRALLNGRKIQISLQLPERDLTWRVASMAHWTLLKPPSEGKDRTSDSF